MRERGSERPRTSAGSVWASLGVALLCFLAADLALFWTPLYRSLLAPDSSAGTFEAMLARLGAFPAARERDVLVLGDSRLVSGLDPARAASGGLRFVDAAIPGTTPRCWLYLVRAADRDAHRFRAVLISVDTFADDDSAIGSLDGDDRPFDLRYLAFSTAPGDAWPLARTFSDPRVRADEFVALLLRGPLVRDDLQALLADPFDRATKLRAARMAPSESLEAAHARNESLAGLRVDFDHDRIEYPPGVAPSERAEIATQVLRRAQPSASYARYRREWLGAIVERYRATNTPVIFVRIPTRPVHRDAPSAGPNGTLAEFARLGAQFIPQSKYVALERPELFADHDHLNRAGSARFSELLGHDVAAVLAGVPDTTARVVPPFTPKTPHVAPPAPHFPNLAIVLGVGVPIAFQSYEYFLFFAIVAALFYALPRRAGRIVLLVASWYFYARWNAWYVVFLLGLSATDYVAALWLERTPAGRRQLILALGIAVNLAFLGVFKYANFTTGSLAALFGLQHDPWLVNWIVPVGISFHTFQSISYLVDVYRGKIAAVRAPLDYALYIAFFPQLLAGPIVRAERFFGELYHWRRPTADHVLRGIGEVALGLVKKIAIADQLAVVADAYFRHPAAHPGAPAAWSGVLAFTFQIYFDFSGYSDIAIGSARLLGFDFPPNFRRPYLATGLSDFWRRWHISLSTWLRDYLYVPLGGNRGGKLATIRNVMLTMLLGGLWHGANWTFVAWGGYHGALLSSERVVGIGRRDERLSAGFIWIARVVATFTLVCFGWILFRAESFGEALTVFRATLAGGAGQWLLPLWTLAPVAVATVIAIAQERGWTPARLRASPLAYGGALAALVLALELLSVSGESPPFIYFRF